MEHVNVRALLLGLGVLLCMLASQARAQTSESLLLVPWADPQGKIEAHGDGFIMPETHFDKFNTGLSLSESEISARYRFGTTIALEPSIGVNATSLYISDKTHLLPNNLTDMSIAAGTPFGLVNGWFVAATAGAGYAGQDPFTQGRGVYGIGSIMVGKEVKPHSYLIAAIDYNGNREFMPDVPLPGVEYRSQWSADLQYTIGVPLNAVTWTPRPDFTLTVQWQLVRDVDATAEYKLGDKWTLFGDYASREEPYHVANVAGDTRLFFKENRVELGIRWDFSKAVGLQVAGGYAFARSFATGFDDQNLHGVSDLRDEPYARVGLNVSY